MPKNTRTVVNLAIQRVKSQGTGNLKLVIKKNMIMWAGTMKL